MFTLKAKANLFGDYVSNEPQEVEQRRTVGTGSRSNCQSNITKNSVSLMVPKQGVVHHTSVEKPSFFLIANQVSSAEPFKFTLIDPQTATTLVEKTFFISEGIEQIELPESTRLKSGKVYLWRVTIPCTNNPNEDREVLGAAVKRRKPSSRVKTQLHRSKSNSEKAAIYARNGFWYEALEMAVRERNRARREDKDNSYDYLNRLLNSAELNFPETAELYQTSK